MIVAIILSAGASTRMGSPKALLKIGEKTFLQNIVDELPAADVSDIIIILGADYENIQSTLSWFDGNVVINNDWQQGQLSSLIAGINFIEKNNVDGIIVCPVDHPIISAKLISEMVSAFYTSKKKIILPTHNKQRGHPIIFSKELFEEIKNAPVEIGAKSVVKKFPEEVYEIETNESGILINIDTENNYSLLSINSSANQSTSI